MARAYLDVDVSLREAFLSSQDDRGVRWVCGRIEGEVVLLSATGPRVGSAGEDFESLRTVAQLEDDAPAFVLFARDEEDAAARSWMLVAWVPDSAAPRLKMLYSSSREDLKSGLGSGYFLYKDYCANSASDLAWASVEHGEASVSALTETEVLLNEEKKLEKDASIRSSGMAAVPFHPSADLEAALGGDESLEVAVVDVALELVRAGPPQAQDQEPRFLVVKEQGKTLFVYFCPDSAPIKAKMTYSTAKAAFLDILSSRGVAVDKSIEVRDAADLAGEIAEAAGENKSDSREIAHAVISKPARPGRPGTRKPKKKFEAPPLF